MPKLDLKKDFKELYTPSAKEAVLVQVPAMGFVMIDGEGDPSVCKDYTDAIEALYGVSYTIKFALKKAASEIDYAVAPLEGLWWADDMSAFTAGNRDQWKWTAMIAQPPHVAAEIVAKALEELKAKKPNPALAKVRFECFHEGLCAQIMHIGPYSAEPPTIAKLHDFIAAQEMERRGKHHEIYLGDPRRTAPEKLKTVIRQPVE